MNLPESSEDFRRLSERLFTFSGITFALKVIPVKEVAFSEVRLELNDKPLAVGVLAILVAYLCMTCLSLYVRDWMRSVSARARDRPIAMASAPARADVIASPASAGYIQPLAILDVVSGMLQDVFPLIFGAVVVASCWHEVFRLFT